MHIVHYVVTPKEHIPRRTASGATSKDRLRRHPVDELTTLLGLVSALVKLAAAVIYAKAKRDQSED